jgi:hypothetical protein
MELLGCVQTKTDSLTAFRDSAREWHFVAKSQAPNNLPSLHIEFDISSFASQVLGELGVPHALGAADVTHTV